MPEGPPAPEPESGGPLARLLGASARTGLRSAGRVAGDAGLDDVVADAVVRALESPAAERAIVQALESPAVERSLNRALDSEMVDRIWERLLASEETQKLVERIAQAPEVRSAIAYQGVGLVDDVGAQIGRIARHLDDAVERIARAILRRPQRSRRPQQAGLVTRALALVVDGALVNGALLGLSSLLAFALRELFGIGDLGLAGVLAGSVAWAAATTAYLVGFWGLSGETPGMRFFDLRLEGPGGPRIGPRRAFRRLVGGVLAVLPFGLGLVPILFDERRRGLQDRLADTEVRYLPPRREAPWSREGRPGDPPESGREPRPL